MYLFYFVRFIFILHVKFGVHIISILEILSATVGMVEWFNTHHSNGKT